MICGKVFSSLKGTFTLLHKRNAVLHVSYSIAISEQNCTETADNRVTGLQNCNKFKVMCLFVYTKVSFSDHITVLLVQLNEIFNMDKVLFCCKKKFGAVSSGV